LLEVGATTMAKSGHFGKVEANYFTGEWPDGTRTDMSAQVGFSFVPHTDFKISALGRKLNKAGNVLAETTLTLWGPHKEKLIEVPVSPIDIKEDGYIWKELEEAVDVKENQEYRLTQGCAFNMADPWWDGFIHDTNVHIHDQTAAAYAEIRHGVSSDDEFGFPENEDGLGRRASMLNFRVWVFPTYTNARCCSGHTDEMCLQGEEQTITLPGYEDQYGKHAPRVTNQLTFDECMDRCRYQPKDSPCMGIEYGQISKCGEPSRCICQLISEGGCGSYTPDMSFGFYSVFGPTHTVRLSQRKSGRLEVIHDHVWGTVCKNGFTINDALVVCRQMHLWNGAVLLPESIGGTGSGQIWMSEVMCEGGEPEVEECAFGGWGLHSCTHAMDVGVNCTQPEAGPPGPQGPYGLPGPKANESAEDFNGTVGKQGFTGLTGPPGFQGVAGLDRNRGPPGPLLPAHKIFMVNSWGLQGSWCNVNVFIVCVIFCFGVLYFMVVASENVMHTQQEQFSNMSSYLERQNDEKAAAGAKEEKW